MVGSSYNQHPFKIAMFAPLGASEWKYFILLLSNRHKTWNVQDTKLSKDFPLRETWNSM